LPLFAIKKTAFSTLYIHPQVSLHKIELWFLYTLLRGGSTGNTGQLFLSPILEKGDTVITKAAAVLFCLQLPLIWCNVEKFFEITRKGGNG